MQKNLQQVFTFLCKCGTIIEVSLLRCPIKANHTGGCQNGQ